MRGTTIGALGLGAILAGCPLPQPLPDYPPGTITPPRILQENIWPQETTILVGTDCLAGEEPVYTLDARVYDTNNIEQVEARWFVNYDATVDAFRTPEQNDILSADPDPLILARDVPAYVFRPYRHPPPLGTTLPGPGPEFRDPATIRVVELLVSNGFSEPPQIAVPPYRGTVPNFETQLQRWVFVLVPGQLNCGPQTRP